MVLTDDAVTFVPNRLNRSVQSGLSTIAVDLDTIAGVEVLPGFLTKIISLDTPGHRLKIRCFGTRALAERIRAAVAGRGGS